MIQEKNDDYIPKRLYSMPEAARYLGRTVCAVREMVWAGEIKYVRDGRRIFLDRQKMDAWIEQHTTVNKF
jgi:excisionase family DNA binding protein